jgi:hypothetical protein
LVVAALGPILASPALAESEQAEFDKVRDHFAWTAWSDARPVSPFFGIPFEFTQGAPFARSYLDSLPGRSEAFAGYYYADDTIEETYEASGYKNRTLSRSNFPDTGRGSEAEFAPAGPNGPRSAAKTPSRTEAYGETRNGPGNESFMAGSYARTSAVFNRTDTFVGESTGAAQAVRLGDGGSIGLIESWLKVEHRINSEPRVSYRMTLADVHAGGQQLVGVGDQGITLAGNNVAGRDLASQFNSQVKQHGGALEAVVAKLSLRLLEPRVQKEHDGAYRVTGPVAELRSDNTPRKNQAGDNAGLRLGYIRIYSYLVPVAEGSSSGGEAAPPLGA